MLRHAVFEVVVLLTNIMQCITGFAGTVLAMPFSVMLEGYDVARPVLNVLGVGASLVIVIKEYKHINIKEFRKMAGVMLLGIIGGLYLKELVSGNPSVIYKILGTIVVVFSIISAVRFFRKKDGSPIPGWLAFILLVISGIVHGLFVCGGPVLVTYASTKLKDNSEFRSTVSAVWLVLNSIIFVQDIMSGIFVKSTVYLTLVSLAVLALSLVIGNLIFKKMSRNVFLVLTYVLMFISGITLLIK
ncbi:MAG: sulfite exporter TauE/SafE family protein [Clostridia bacterium]|nr:sulfite exporter TauE/SafE family protein [Clostridia bacterium]